jgi:nucleoid-associated protein YgaU
MYVVQPGDCLWSIAAHHLGPGADARSIDAGWRRIYDTNRLAVGDDPSLIHVGLVLRLPPLAVQP